MKKILILTVLTAMFAACSLDLDYRYQAPKDSICFDYEKLDTAKRNVIYSFAYFPGLEKETIQLPVRVSGEQSASPRRFRVEVDAKNTTAVAGTHFEPLPESYILEAGETTVTVPLTLYNTDPEMREVSMKLTLKLVASDDFEVAIPYLTTMAVTFSNRLEKPEWWETSWIGELGIYDRNKHFLFNAATDNADLTVVQGDFSARPYGLHKISQYKSLLANPYVFIEKNPEYRLEMVNPPYYNFYHENDPMRSVQFMPTPGNPTQAGMFFLENGTPITL